MAYLIVGLLITYITVAAAWAFMLLYHVATGGAWLRDIMGWHIMILTGVDAGIFTMLGAADLDHHLALLPAYRWAYMFVVAGIPAVTIWRMVILWRLYRPRKREKVR